MRKEFKRNVVMFFLFMLLLFWGDKTVFALSLGVDSFPQNFTVGDSIPVNIRISGLTSFGGYEIGLGYDPLLLGYQNIRLEDPLEGNVLDPLGRGTSGVTFASGVVTFSQSLPIAGGDMGGFFPPDFIISQIVFKALQSGNSELIPVVNSFRDSRGSSLPLEEVTGRNVQIEPATQVPVAEPSTILLYVVGLLALSYSLIPVKVKVKA